MLVFSLMDLSKIVTNVMVKRIGELVKLRSTETLSGSKIKNITAYDWLVSWFLSLTLLEDKQLTLQVIIKDKKPAHVFQTERREKEETKKETYQFYNWIS